VGELIVGLHVNIALNLLAHGKEKVQLRADAGDAGFECAKARSRAVIAGHLLEHIADEADVDLPVKNLGSVRDRRLEISRTSRALRQGGGAGENALSVRRSMAGSPPSSEESTT